MAGSKNVTTALAEEQKAQTSVVIDIEANDPSQLQQTSEWLNSIMYVGIESSDSTQAATMPKHKIQRVPRMLRKMQSDLKPSEQNCYEPEVVSIGPIHHRNEDLKPFEKLKQQLTRDYVLGCTKAEKSAVQVYNKVAEVSGEARKCYAEELTVGYNDTVFNRMMFLDGCFVLQFIDCIMSRKQSIVTELKSHDVASVQRDLFLLENQLPFVVLRALMSLRYDGDTGVHMIEKFIAKTRASPPKDAFREKVENFISSITSRRSIKSSIGSEGSAKHEPAHLLELVRRQLVNPKAFDDYSFNKNNDYWYSFRSVQELMTSGIHFRPNKKSNFFTDARYENQIIRAILRLPPMTIDDSIESLLLNLVAYEMCPDGPNDFGVTSYVWFIDTLIDTAEDVKELRKRGIILNYLGSDDDVAKLFNGIAKNLVPSNEAYSNLQKQIEAHYKNKVWLWMTEWINTHFTSPWTFLALFGAIVAIALSLIQTYFTIYPR